MVAPSPHPPDPKHGLEAPEREPKRTNGGVFPVADAHDVARCRVHVNIFFQEIVVVGHQRPIFGKEPREVGDERVQTWAKAFGQPFGELRELRRVLAKQRDTAWTRRRARRVVSRPGEEPAFPKSAAQFP